MGLDRWFYEHVSLVLNTLDTRPFDRCFYAMTKPFWMVCRWFFGYGLAAALILIADVALDGRRWRIALAATATIAITGMLANVAQAIIGRARPNQNPSALHFEPWVHAWDSSRHLPRFDKEGLCFPSGEAATALAAAAVLSRLYPRWRFPFYAAGTIGGVARLVNGAHYISDVAAGGLFGALLAGWLIRRLLRGRAAAPLQPGAEAVADRSSVYNPPPQ